MAEVPPEILRLGKSGASYGKNISLVEGLAARSGELASELVEFAQDARFAKERMARKKAAADGMLLDSIGARPLVHFALQQRLHDGTAIVERFVEHRMPPLATAERAILLGWSHVVEGVFEVSQTDDLKGTLVLHNLIDDLRYIVHCSMCPEALADLGVGMFVHCCIVPVLPATDHWLISGDFSPFPRAARRVVAQTALRMAIAHPGQLYRNLILRHRSWQMQADARADFIGHFGSDVVIMAPAAAQEAMTEHQQRRLQEAMTSAQADGRPARFVTNAPTPEQISRLPEGYMEADSVGLIYDEVEGLNYYLDFGHLDALFANPDLTHDEAYLSLLRDYLSDDTVSPLPLRRLVERHPDGTDPVFRAVLSRPSFSWRHHGEALLWSRKREYFQRGVSPDFAVIGERLADLLCAP
ncbi:hypothetical protein [Streptomyces virginiae]|uniref:hypothetical protein n=1 Tax=Streptomyces virginiae TaxID=1961 RepID=UPI00332D8523